MSESASRRLRSKLKIAFTSLLVTLVLIEIGVRVYIDRFASARAFMKYASFPQLIGRFAEDQRRHTPHVYTVYHGTPNFVKGDPESPAGLNRHNVLGYRGEEIEQPKPEGRFRIVCMGGSTTYTSTVNNHLFTYPHLLQEQLRERTGADLDVVNSGQVGWTSWETQANFLVRVLDLDPDLIIIYHAVNDLHARLVYPYEDFRSDNWGKRRPPESTLVMPNLLEYSAACRMFMVWTGIVRSHSVVDRFRAPAPPSYMADEFNKQWVAREYPKGLFEEVPAEEMMLRNTPLYFRRNIENIVMVARARGIEVVLATFAHTPGFRKVAWSDSELHARGYEEMNAVTRSIAEEQGVHLYDFASVFPKDKSLYTDGIHVTKKGSHLKARYFADYVIEQGLIPE